MIEYEKLVPEVYIKESRDFQLLARIRTVLFNYLKNNTEVLSNAYEDSSKLILSLLATTYGIDANLKLSNEELVALSSIYMDVIKNKGSLNALKLVAKLLPKLNGCDEDIEILVDADGTLELWVPPQVTNTNLIEQLIEVILPAGTKFHVFKNSLVTTDLITELSTEDTYTKSINKVDDSKTSYAIVTKLNNNDPESTPEFELDINSEGVVVNYGIKNPGEVKGSIDNVLIPRKLKEDSD